MKKTMCLFAAVLLLFGCAFAEGMTTEPWEHEGGWMAFPVAMVQEGLEGTWSEGAKVFGEKIGFPALTGDQLQQMMLQGYSLADGPDELLGEGGRFTGWKDGKELFSHEYSFVETIEDKDVMEGTRVHVFKTEDQGAGAYTYLLMTEPLTTEGETASYVTFNLFHAKGEYRKLFTAEDGGTITPPSAMIQKDTSEEGLEQAIVNLYVNSEISFQ